MTLRDIYDFVTHFVSFSILVAGLGFLHNYRKEVQRRDNERAQRTRELLGQLRTAAYVTLWRSLGDGDVEIAVLRLRDELAKRAGPTPTADAIRAVLADQLLREALVHDAFKTSGLNARAEDEVTAFARLRASIAFSNAAVESALDQIEGGLRVRLLRASSVVVALRAAGHPLRGGEDPADGQPTLTRAHQVLRRDASLPRDEAMTDALKLILELGNTVLHAPTTSVLQLHASAGLPARARQWWTRRREAQRSSTDWARRRARVLARHPGQPGLADALDALAAMRRAQQLARRSLADAGARLATIFSDTEGSVRLKEAGAAFLDARCQKVDEEQRQLDELLALKERGIDDPDIDLFLAAVTGVTALAKSACDRGGDPSVGILAVLRRHQARAAEPLPAGGEPVAPQREPSAA